MKEILTRESPLSYVQNIATPFIIFHSGNDCQSGFIQAEMIFSSLKVLNCPFEFVVHWVQPMKLLEMVTIAHA